MAHLAEMEALQKEQTLVMNKCQVSNYHIFTENQNQPQFFQPLNLNELDEHSASSWSSVTTINSNREPLIGNHNIIHEVQGHSGSLNQYESL